METPFELLQNTLHLSEQEIDWEKIHHALAAHLNTLITSDFNKVMSLLYQVDVSEKKVRETLYNSKENAGNILATLIIERQQQKIALRKRFSK